jgi:hypothetical protein
MDSGGYAVRPAVLTSASAAFDGFGGKLSSMSSAIRANPLQATAFGGLPQSSTAAMSDNTTLNGVGADLDTERADCQKISGGLKSSAAGYTTSDNTFADRYQALTPETSVPAIGTRH